VEIANLVIRHNALGLRDTGIEAKNLTRDGLIFVYGDSSTYDTALPQGSTWAERLNSFLGPEFKVFNFGVPTYGTTQHLIQTAFYGDIDGVYPACAVYYVGWNDIRNVWIANLDRGYANFHLPNQASILRTRRSLAIMTVSPALKIAVRAAGLLLDTIPSPSPKLDTSPDADKHTAFKTIYQSHIDTIAAINRARGVKTLVIGQLMNRERLTSDEISAPQWEPFIKDSEVWPLLAEFNALLKGHAANAGYDFIDVDINAFDNSDFADEGHFNSKGANKFASLIQGDVKRLCSPL
jgi:lysophospholipase L1-like esterase